MYFSYPKTTNILILNSISTSDIYLTRDKWLAISVDNRQELTFALITDARGSIHTILEIDCKRNRAGQGL